MSGDDDIRLSMLLLWLDGVVVVVIAAVVAGGMEADTTELG